MNLLLLPYNEDYSLLQPEDGTTCWYNLGSIEWEVPTKISLIFDKYWVENRYWFVKPNLPTTLWKWQKLQALTIKSLMLNKWWYLYLERKCYEDIQRFAIYLLKASDWYEIFQRSVRTINQSTPAYLITVGESWKQK